MEGVARQPESPRPDLALVVDRGLSQRPSFLSIFTSDNPNNRTGWKNAAFDELIARSDREQDPLRRDRLLASAERILLEEVPAIPIYAYVAQNVVNPRLGGFHSNLLNEQNPTFWYGRATTSCGRSGACASARSSPCPRAARSRGCTPSRPGRAGRAERNRLRCAARCGSCCAVGRRHARSS
jgi:hypothetical protein